MATPRRYEARNEAALVRMIVKAIMLEHPSAWVMKVHGSAYQQAGTPDLLVCVDGRLHGIEVKHRKPGESMEHCLGRVTLLQQAAIEKIRAAGGVAGVATSVAEALALIDHTL